MHGNYDRKFLTNILPHSKLLLCVILEMFTIGMNILVPLILEVVTFYYYFSLLPLLDSDKVIKNHRF